MKKLIIVVLFAATSVLVGAQGIFKPVPSFTLPNSLKSGETIKTSQWLVRFDATISLAEVIRNNETKTFSQYLTAGIGPAIGYQHFVPKSDIDPTPVNNYGVSVGALLGEQMKFVLQGNLFEYFRFGVTYTPNPYENLAHVGLFFGTGITF